MRTDALEGMMTISEARARSERELRGALRRAVIRANRAGQSWGDIERNLQQIIDRVHLEPFN